MKIFFIHEDFAASKVTDEPTLEDVESDGQIGSDRKNLFKSFV